MKSRAVRRSIPAVAVIAVATLLPLAGYGQRKSAPRPAIVQPGAPGSPTRTLPATTRGSLPPVAAADVQFMQGMITHHAQAVEMTALIESRTTNPDVRGLGARISHTQADEIRFMKRWLITRGFPVAVAGGHEHHHHMSHAMMPGMLTPEQMKALAAAQGAEFDRLFLAGMIQHHGGALTMVDELFSAAGAGQEAELFNFATDVDSGQRAEIRIMQTMLEKIPTKENR